MKQAGEAADEVYRELEIEREIYVDPVSRFSNKKAKWRSRTYFRNSRKRMTLKSGCQE